MAESNRDTSHSWLQGSTESERRSLLSDRTSSSSMNCEGEFLSPQRRRAALGCILFCEFALWVPLHSILQWIPRTFDLLSTDEDSDSQKFRSYLLMMLLYTLPFIAGVIMDAFVKRTHVLITGMIFASAGIISIFSIIMKQSAYAFDTSNSNTIYALSVMIIIMEALVMVAIPTLGGDQIPERAAVRSFYAAFYFAHKAGEIVACAVYLPYMKVHIKPNDSMQWSIIVIVFTVLSLATALLVVCCNWTRQVGAHVNAIKNPFRVWNEAWKRRKFRNEGDSILSAAQQSNGGKYPDAIVNDISDVSKLAVILFGLMPVSFAVYLPTLLIDRNCWNIPELKLSTKNHSAVTDSEFIMPHPSDLYADLASTVTCMLAIPAIHIACLWLAKRGRRPTLLHRFVAGHLVVMLANVLALVNVKIYSECIDTVLIPPYALCGLGNAFIFTTGYELTLMSAPRSMQGTAMGMLHVMDGISRFVLYYLTISIFKDNSSQLIFGIGGIGGAALGMILLIVVEAKFNLGLSNH